ncbi:hypothetical protein DSO57_1012309 [Entomophthora muscae]|uniref:Uncharacterized protein n=1 Tax=Entomophthora muscae TaxID=34485 RepID=A0ACC2T622_9FUNG|nr:hypothetical protein DSO57_1012309 [Entomophthora muscae]
MAISKSFLSIQLMAKAGSQPDLRESQLQTLYVAPCWADDESDYVSDTTVSGDLGSPHEESFSLDFNYHCAPPHLAPTPLHVRSSSDLTKFLSRTPSYFARHRRTSSSPSSSHSYAEFDLFEDGDMLTPFTPPQEDLAGTHVSTLDPVPEHEFIPEPITIPENIIAPENIPTPELLPETIEEAPSTPPTKSPRRLSSFQSLLSKPSSRKDVKSATISAPIEFKPKRSSKIRKMIKSILF